MKGTMILEIVVDTGQENGLHEPKVLNKIWETQKFLDAYHVKISELLAALKLWGCLELLSVYDYEHKKIYESYLEY